MSDEEALFWRNMYAAFALLSLCISHEENVNMNSEELAFHSFAIADKMVKEMKK